MSYINFSNILLLLSLLTLIILTIDGAPTRTTPTLVNYNTTIIVGPRFYVNVPLKFYLRSRVKGPEWPLWLIILVAVIGLAILGALIGLFFYATSQLRKRRRRAAQVQPQSSILNDASKRTSLSSMRPSVSQRSALSRTSRPKRLSASLGVSEKSKSTSSSRRSGFKPSSIATSATRTHLPRSSSTKGSTSSRR